ncbi:MAG TPA: lytic transglycosylase domain-containing protein [Allosphingosinicella sp.]|jgi:soluble lytic murein transglycosylase-like protein|uniref:lytic transglycosylase domain-containing protein n=1 Tax=Allosphingosinicella sp. TaxID=2823234 RepID=UPI002F278FD4
MGPLKLALLAGSAALSTPAAADPIDAWGGQIAEASARFAVPEVWIRRVMRAESGGRTSLKGRPIVSHAGAMGLMQLMPGTWREMRALLGLGADPHDPRDNILAGTAYLRAMYDRFGYPGLFAAYNAGPRRYAEHLASGRRLPTETISYVSAVAGTSARADSAPPEPAQPPPLFAYRSTMQDPPAQRDNRPRSGDGATLFVPLSAAVRR